MMEKEKEIIYNAGILFPYLEKFEHKDLFKNTAYVWEAVPKIAAYLKNYLKDTDHALLIKTRNGYLCGIKTLNHIFAGAFSDLNNGSVEIGENTIIEPGAFIKGPAIIGRNCEIRHNAYIGGNVIIGNNCVIGHGSEVNNSIIMDYSNIMHFNCIEDSIVGNNVYIGFMSALLNVRADNGFIWLKIIARNGNLLDKKSIPLKRLGAIIGDSCRIGANISLNPGFVLMPGTQIITSQNLAKNFMWLRKIHDTYKELT
ncbi:MAG: hypothetical protein AAB397_01380 [Patescibacteria group bacterium]